MLLLLLLLLLVLSPYMSYDEEPASLLLPLPPYTSYSVGEPVVGDVGAYEPPPAVPLSARTSSPSLHAAAYMDTHAGNDPTGTWINLP